MYSRVVKTVLPPPLILYLSSRFTGHLFTYFHTNIQNTPIVSDIDYYKRRTEMR